MICVLPDPTSNAMTLRSLCIYLDLVAPIERNESQLQCLMKEIETNISHGVICYTGTTPGSMAYTLCDEGYHLDDDNVGKTMTCLDKGEWNGTQPQCYSASTDIGIK